MATQTATIRRSDISFVESILESFSDGIAANGARLHLEEALALADHHVANVARDKGLWKVLRGRLLLASVTDQTDEDSLFEAVERARKALSDLQDEGGRFYLKALLTVGRLLMMRGLMEESLHHFMLASPLAEEIGEKDALGVLQGNIATLQYQMRHYEEAQVWFERAVATFRAAGNTKSMAFAIRGIGMCYSKLNSFEEALERYATALELIADHADATKEFIGITESMGVDYLNLRDATGKQKYFASALAAFETCLEVAERESLPIAKAVALRNLAMTYAEPKFKGRDLERARRYYEVARELVRRSGTQLLESQILRDLSAVLEELGDLEGALDAFRNFYEMERLSLSQETESKIKALELKLATEQQEADARVQRAHAVQLTADLEQQRQQVTATSLSIGHKNAVLRETRTELRKLADEAPSQLAGRINRLIRQIEMAEDGDTYWDDLEHQLMLAHGRELDALATAFPDLTTTERRVCAMIMHDLSTKDIARLLSIEPRSVEKYRQRIRKKLRVDEGTNLSSFLSSITG